MEKSILIICLALLGCHQIHEGKIIEKHVEPAHSYTWYSYHKIGKYGGVMVPHTCMVPERYALEIKGVDKHGDTLEEKFYVPFEEYKCECVGAYFNDTMPCERNDGR